MNKRYGPKQQEDNLDINCTQLHFSTLCVFNFIINIVHTERHTHVHAKAHTEIYTFLIFGLNPEHTVFTVFTDSKEDLSGKS